LIHEQAAGSCPQSAALPLIRAIVTVVNKASRVAHASGSEDGVQIPPTDMLALLVYYSFASGVDLLCPTPKRPCVGQDMKYTHCPPR
jgi:hypothetical protein